MIAGQLLVVTVLTFIQISFEFPINLPEKAKVPSPKVLDFLKKFGYIEEDDANSGALYTESGIADTIKIVQKFGAIEETGVLDNATLGLMSSPRCGVPDIIKNKRRKRFAFGSGGWNKRTITYFIANWSPKIGEDSVVKNIQLALDTWGKYGHLTFRRAPTPDADIIVAFGSHYHGDRYPFDGPGNILAHAFFPYEDQGFGGDIHFDADENWIDQKDSKNDDGMDFATVALHELGHSLGLSHSVVPNSVMFPYYRGYDPNGQLQLGYDDILGMYELYIRRDIKDDTYIPTTSRADDVTARPETTSTSTSFVTNPTSAVSRTTINPRTDKNSGVSTLDPFFTTTHQELPSETTTDIFQTTDIVARNSTSAVTTTTRSITSIGYEDDVESVETHKDHDPKHDVLSTNSPSLPNICDGYFDAVAVLREELFIFKEQYVWRLKEMSKVESGYPILITQMFPDLPKTVKQIDAAYERPDGMIILFTGNLFWVYDGKSFVENSPKSLSYYGLPTDLDKIDAVQKWTRNGKTYFYRHDRFWRYNETVQRMDEGYPKHMERWRGVPHDLDAATTWKGITYFFKDELYWKFDNNWVIITDQSPLPAPQLWVGCPEDDRTLLRILRDDY